MQDEYRRVVQGILEAREEFETFIGKETECWDCYGLTVQQELMMGYIIRHEPVLARDIAADFHISKSAVSQVLAKLEQRGMLLREANPANRREILVRLGERGKKYAATVESVMNQVVEKYYSCIPLEDLQQVLRTWRTLNRIIKERSQ